MIGQDVRLRQVILWQYEEAERLIGLVDILQHGYDKYAKGFWESWYRDVFNVDTANDFGLSVWAKILNVKLTVDFEPQPAKFAFGFSRERQNFYPDTNFGARYGAMVNLTTEQKRMVIRARYFELTNRPTLDNINQFLKKYFWKGQSKVWIYDPQDMTSLLYTFHYNPDGYLSFLLEYTHILPRPATVGVDVRIIGKDAFGFSKNRKNFHSPVNFGLVGVK